MATIGNCMTNRPNALSAGAVITGTGESLTGVTAAGAFGGSIMEVETDGFTAARDALCSPGF
jgi:hypothetical protein